MDGLFAELFKFTVVIAVVGFMGRSLFKHVLDRDVEKFRSQLEANNAREIEKFKTDLRAASYEREVEFSGLHAKRIEVVGEFHRKLFRAHDSLMEVTGTIQMGGHDDFVKKVAQAPAVVNDLFTYFGEHSIWFDDSVGRNMIDLGDKVRRIWHPFRAVASDSARPDAELWHAARRVFETEVPPILTAIRRQMRQLLGSGVAGA